MADYLAPGVYIEEIERGPKPIDGVPTNTTAFLGETERGPIRPRLVTSYVEYVRWFGDVFADDRFMPDAVRGFFENGGMRVYVCRIVGPVATAASRDFGTFTVRAVGPGAWGRRVWVKFENGSTGGFRMKVAYWSELPNGFEPYDPFVPANNGKLPRPQVVEDFDDLSVDPESPDYFTRRIDQIPSALLVLESSVDAPTNPASTAGEFLDNGDDGPSAIEADDFQLSLTELELDEYRDIALVYAPYPPAHSSAVASKLIDHCEKIRFRFAVIDCDNVEPSRLDPRTTNNWDTSYAAYYAPWIVIADPKSGGQKIVPPGGHVLGIYARADLERGVFKAPANELVRGAVDVRFAINESVQATLNPRGVNAIRSFPGRGIKVWGARTLSLNTLWKYVSVRRLFIFLEHSIYEGTKWAVFEPNDERLWARVKDTIRMFLRTQWLAGALFGQKEEQAFFINCDRTTMTQDDIDNGSLICEIGVAPVRPAEFVIFRIFQKTAETKR
jgi:phage tail sheath protein FI